MIKLKTNHFINMAINHRNCQIKFMMSYQFAL